MTKQFTEKLHWKVVKEKSILHSVILLTITETLKTQPQTIKEVEKLMAFLEPIIQTTIKTIKHETLQNIQETSDRT